MAMVREITVTITTEAAVARNKRGSTKLSGVIFGGGDLEGRYRVEAARPRDRVCYLNLDHPTVPNWLWVNEQRLLNRASVAPSQLHPNAWSGIRCFELVTDSLRLSQDLEVFLYLFTLFSPSTEGKTKKGYMSVRPGNIGRSSACTKILFMTSKDISSKFSLLGQGRFPPYWSRDTGMDYVLVTYKGLNADQKDTADILVKLISERNLKPKTVLSNPSEAREAIGGYPGASPSVDPPRFLLECAGRFCSRSGPSKTLVEPQPIPAGGDDAFPEGVVRATSARPTDDATAEPKRPRVSEGTYQEFGLMDRSFDASDFIASNLLGPRAQEWEGRCVKLNGDLKALNLQRIEAEKENLVAEQARVKAEGDLKSLSGKLDALEREKVQEVERRKDRESKLEGEIRDLRKLVSDGRLVPIM
ncbi:hypothetical protein PIB30_095221 [Stylosanthes scabra]|uniref:Uncharacterized protein n=1 Tax=Stylosanthes scabra TaxID=79078 RepID=A0ABU6WYR6_9FABA|nr:hypothetical protein [Stylosanthes scabra]